MLVEATLSQRFFQLLLQSGPGKLEERQSGSNKITHAHIEPNDEAFCLAVRQTGLDIRIFNQPANSPDLNVLDLGFFASLQSKTFLTNSKNMDELIQNVQKEFSTYDESKIRNVFLTLQGYMIEVMKKRGGNGYRSPI